ncbi:MAG: TetR/AcrR family transcriptional regulator [Kangiellaceae bacterium]|nr:TetR/AcrR family transcriptional regulator [Kangiellaceae bacterium]
MNLTRQQSALITREKIVSAAFNIVGREGYESLTTNSLISEAGVAKGTLYHHFSNLDEVVYSMIQMILDQSLNDVPVEKFESLADYLDAIGKYLMEDFTQNPQIMNIVFGFLPKGMKDLFFKSVGKDMLENACNRIAPAMQKFYSGRLSEEKIDKAIRMVDMFTVGFCVHFTIFEEKQKYLEIWQDFSELMINYLET